MILAEDAYLIRAAVTAAELVVDKDQIATNLNSKSSLLSSVSFGNNRSSSESTVFTRGTRTNNGYSPMFGGSFPYGGLQFQFCSNPEMPGIAIYFRNKGLKLLASGDICRFPLIIFQSELHNHTVIGQQHIEITTLLKIVLDFDKNNYYLPVKGPYSWVSYNWPISEDKLEPKTYFGYFDPETRKDLTNGKIYYNGYGDSLNIEKLTTGVPNTTVLPTIVDDVITQTTQTVSINSILSDNFITAALSIAVLLVLALLVILTVLVLVALIDILFERFHGNNIVSSNNLMHPY
ncbi:hypothetical protein DFJ63DRAFT_334097 [Scheffersomyces coipomensis]|uniref:uncharacterized protein n=1 Tax=Scheffersomyces coipomensis TaxID=1788519 RepID=UPI00315C70EB